jgi:Ca2+-binding RTX toxin-like protein
MPTQSTNVDSLTFTAANQQWIIENGVIVGSANAIAGAVNMGFAGDSLVNNGIVFVPQGIALGGPAVVLTSAAAGSTVTNSATGLISGLGGISAATGSVKISNDGSIVGFTGIGIDYGQGTGAELDNTGYVFGKTVAVRGTLLDGFTMVNSGVIKSDGDGVVLLVTGEVQIINSGKISAADKSSAIIASGQGATVQVANQGVIKGDVELSPGADIFDSRGGVTRDKVLGDDGNDTLSGGSGNDELHGENGQDVINGRGGNDLLIGGADGDTLQGRGGNDDFTYTDVSDSTGNSAATRDTILDFDGGEGDVIDLHALDAKIGNGNQKFDFIATNAFTGQKGQLRYEVDDGSAIIQADLTGDGKADMAIVVMDVTKLSASDFDL